MSSKRSKTRVVSSASPSFLAALAAQRESLALAAEESLIDSPQNPAQKQDESSSKNNRETSSLFESLVRRDLLSRLLHREIFLTNPQAFSSETSEFLCCSGIKSWKRHQISPAAIPNHGVDTASVNRFHAVLACRRRGLSILSASAATELCLVDELCVGGSLPWQPLDSTFIFPPPSLPVPSSIISVSLRDATADSSGGVAAILAVTRQDVEFKRGIVSIYSSPSSPSMSAPYYNSSHVEVEEEIKGGLAWLSESTIVIPMARGRAAIMRVTGEGGSCLGLESTWKAPPQYNRSDVLLSAPTHPSSSSPGSHTTTCLLGLRNGKVLLWDTRSPAQVPNLLCSLSRAPMLLSSAPTLSPWAVLCGDIEGQMEVYDSRNWSRGAVFALPADGQQQASSNQVNKNKGCRTTRVIRFLRDEGVLLLGFKEIVSVYKLFSGASSSNGGLSTPFASFTPPEDYTDIVLTPTLDKGGSVPSALVMHGTGSLSVWRASRRTDDA